MMYEMLSGHLPFDADDMVEVAIKQISDQPKSLHELSLIHISGAGQACAGAGAGDQPDPADDPAAQESVWPPGGGAALCPQPQIGRAHV